MKNNVLYSDLAKQLCEKLEIDLSVLKEHVPKEDWNPDCFLMDKSEFFIKCVCVDPVKKIFAEKQCIYRKNIYLIDYFPKVISLDNKFPQLELFYRSDDKYGLNDLFFEESNKVLRVLFRLWAYSDVYIESCISHYPLEEKMTKEEQLDVIQQLFFKSKIVQMEEWKSIQRLCELSLKNRVSVCMYLVDLKMIIWLSDLCPTVYICDEEQVDFVRTICMTEGVYLRK